MDKTAQTSLIICVLIKIFYLLVKAVARLCFRISSASLHSGSIKRRYSQMLESQK
ncbi:unknown protein [Microcystis aeruginosa NIES-843]|uniref:Uncharacterized protein n=1 Tax=Microcystis aeruginosa (strain NIES-843 / IAM M-2473) TaxID=449447 RepID=B0JMB1_MICAN|nr:unknown protein [Microcystis aeruginosa NIES-843]